MAKPVKVRSRLKTKRVYPLNIFNVNIPTLPILIKNKKIKVKMCTRNERSK